MKAICDVCPRACAPAEGQTGFCGARENRGGAVVCGNYGRLTALALDPIEKKPLLRFYPGTRILSVGSYGCNLRCPFCQNSDIALPQESPSYTSITPEQLVEKAVRLRQDNDNIGIAYTYNEPLVGWEFVRDCARLAHGQELLNVVVTNGYLCEGPLAELLSYIDAMNIDLKGFTERFYKMVGGDLETVKRSISLAAEVCHVEVTTLVVPGENDDLAEMEAQAKWMASVNPRMPLHISRFFPRFCMTDKQPTPLETMERLAQVARGYLEFVYLGND